MLEHGGKLVRAAQRYHIPLQDWLDLSTGINPHSWPVPPIPAAAWARLPEPEDNLLEAACAYYHASALLPVAGTQAAIQALPALRNPGRVGVLSPAYAEHAHAWRRFGHTVVSLSASEILAGIDALEVLVLINPNNPTGMRFDKSALLDWHARLAARGGWLIVDEAFMDATPEHGLSDGAPRPGLIVLRSLGKFFGLAGARVGFVLAETAVLDKLDRLLGPWTVPGPSRYIASLALQDRAWQEHMRQRLPDEARRLVALLSECGLPSSGATLFQWTQTPHAARLHEGLARRGILTRLFDTPSSLRFGLPGDESQWARLERELRAVTMHANTADTWQAGPSPP